MTTSLLQEVKAVMAISCPVTVNMIFYRAPWLTSLFFVGRLGKDSLAAAALASTIANVTGLSIVIGLSSALTSLTSQAAGAVKKTGIKSSKSSRGRMGRMAGNSKLDLRNDFDGECENKTDDDSDIAIDADAENVPTLPLIYLQRALFIHFLFTIPVGLFWLSSTEEILISLQQDPQLSANCSDYLAILSFGLWGHTIMWTLTPWLQAISIANIPAIIAIIVSIVHVPANYFCINTLGLGYLGAAYAMSFSTCFGAFLMYMFVFFVPFGRDKIRIEIGMDASDTRYFSIFRGFWGAISFRGVCQYLSLAVPGLLTISEWWASEVAIFLAGHLKPDPEIAVAAMAIYQSINSSCFMLPVGFSVAASTRVGNFLGSNEPKKAKLNSRVTLFGAAILSGSVSILLYTSDNSFVPSIFSDDSAVVKAAARTIPLLSLYVVGDGIQVTLSGVIKGCGRQCIAAPIVIIAYWVIALPVAYHLSFTKHKGQECDQGFCGVVGLTTGMTVGTWVHCLLIWVVVCCTNWQKEADKAARIIKENKEARKNVSYLAVNNDDESEEIDIENAKFEMEQQSKDDDFFAGLEMRNIGVVVEEEVGIGMGEEEEDDRMDRLRMDDEDNSD